MSIKTQSLRLKLWLPAVADAVLDKTADFKTKAMDALRCDGCSDSD